MAYALGKFALGLCDRCSFEYKLSELKQEWTGFKVCEECYEIKHPQLEPAHHKADPEALREPRPSVSAPTTGLGFVRVSNPVNPINLVSSPIMWAENSDTIGSSFEGLTSTSGVGIVTVTTVIT